MLLPPFNLWCILVAVMSSCLEFVAFIAAAGLGTRLGELTQRTPKCLMPLDEERNFTFLDYAVAQVTALGAQKIIINTHYLADQVRAWHAQQSNSAVPITLIHEAPEILETGGGLKNAWHLFEGKPVLFHTADIFYTFDLAPLITTAHQHPELLMTIAAQTGGVSKALICRGAKLISIKKRMETPPTELAQGGLQDLGFAGAVLIRPQFESYLAKQAEKSFPLFAAVADAVKANEQIHCLHLSGEMYNAGTPERLAEAQAVYRALHRSQ